MRRSFFLLALFSTLFLTAQRTSLQVGAGAAGFPQTTAKTGSSFNLGLVRDLRASGPLGAYVTAGVSRNAYTDRSAAVEFEESVLPCDCATARYDIYEITRNEAYLGGGLRYGRGPFSLRMGMTVGYDFGGEITERRFWGGRELPRPLTVKPGERYVEFGRNTEASVGYNRFVIPVADLVLSYRLNDRFSVGLRYQETLGRYRITRTRYDACSFCRPRRGNSVQEIGNAGVRDLQVVASYRLGSKF